MKRTIWLIVTALAFILSACGQGSEPQAIPTVVLDGGGSNEPARPASSGGEIVTASAVVVPMQDANLSFTSVGRVTAVHVQAGDQVNAGDVLVELDTSILEAKVREAEANLAAAEIQVKYLKRVGTSEQHLEVAENDVARAQALLDSAKAVLAAQTHLTAPMAGTVVSVDIAPYETVSPGQVVVTVGDLSKYRIETTDLSERDVTKVRVGQTATVFIEALGEEFTGKVVDIARISSELGGDVVYTVTIELDQQPAGLLWGMSADVEISVGE
ncbi:MAG: hypothetical protein DPW18_16120 [Chloroflexi bacterium]|nr:hypothetical protein [Chloroflexota bacterium]MDL1944949.1 efflux RND transporter periplasmic adaptor subunit [Chloroflexi bacterium CFX2]